MPWDLITRSLGLGEGGLVRSGLDALLGLVGLEATSPRTPANQRAAFTIAFVALAAKMAKADGRVTAVEAETFERLFDVKASEAANVRHVFNLASGDSAGYESYARQIAGMLATEPRLLRDVFDGLFHIAAADGIIHPQEDAFLRTVAGIFSISSAEFRSIRAAFVRDGTRGADGQSDSPYDVLGVDPAVPDATLKARYLELVRDHHPDSLAARGVPAEFHAAASRKLAVINAAYDEILNKRGLKHPQLAHESVGQ
jgi:DnaJ like chaperone protein